jgi:molecular chaperone GrpE
MSHDATSEQAPDPSTAPDPETGAAPQGDGSPLDALRRERDALQDRLLRTAAEFDNYRKRVDRERKDLREFLIAEALSDLLPVIDDLERALQATGSDADVLRKGVELIHQQMLDVLRKRGAKAIEAVGTDFDPRIHESVMLESSDAHREGEVIAEFRRGYMLGERLLRPSMVKVAKA